MRVLLFSDLLDNWSCHNRTKALKKYLPQHYIEIQSGMEFMRTDVDNIRTKVKQFDIVHFHFSSGIHEFYEILTKREGWPITLGSAIGHRWNSGYEDYGMSEETRQTIETMKTFDGVVALSPQLEKRCIEAGFKNVVYIPNGVDRAIFPDRRKLRVGHVGVLFTAPNGDYKGGDLAREACKRLGFEFSTPGCYGPERGPQQPGQRPQNRMIDWYRTIDVLCQPSAGEGCSNPIMEALSMNIRVVATKEAVVKDLWPYVTLCTRDIDDICKKLDTSSLVRSWESISKEYDSYYDRILTGRQN